MGRFGARGIRRWLDFDDVGAHVGEHLAAEEAPFGGEIEYAIWDSIDIGA